MSERTRPWKVLLSVLAVAVGVITILAACLYGFMYGRLSADREVDAAVEEMKLGLGAAPSTRFLRRSVDWQSGGARPYWDYKYTMVMASGASRDFSIHVLPGRISRPRPRLKFVFSDEWPMASDYLATSTAALRPGGTE